MGSVRGPNGIDQHDGAATNGGGGMMSSNNNNYGGGGPPPTADGAAGGVAAQPLGPDGLPLPQDKPMEKKPARRIGAKPPPDRAPRSIYCFSVKNTFRKKCIEFVEWKPFEFLILVTILGNCVALAVYTPFPAEDTNEMNLILVRHSYTHTYYTVLVRPEPTSAMFMGNASNL